MANNVKQVTIAKTISFSIMFFWVSISFLVVCSQLYRKFKCSFAVAVVSFVVANFHLLTLTLFFILSD